MPNAIPATRQRIFRHGVNLVSVDIGVHSMFLLHQGSFSALRIVVGYEVASGDIAHS